MAQKEIKTCEEYVLNELLQAESKINGLKKENEQLQSDCDIIATKYQELLDLVKVALADAAVKEDAYTNVYVAGSFVGLYHADNPQRDETSLVALTKLIDLAHRVPTREND